MYDHLSRGAPLPASQVVWTRPRRTTAAGVVEDLSADHLPEILQTPQESRIKVEQGLVKIPVP